MEEGRNRGDDKRRKVRGNREGRETEKEPDDLSLITLDLHGKRRELSLARCPLTSAQAPGYMPLPHVCTHMHKIDKFKLHKKFKDAWKQAQGEKWDERSEFTDRGDISSGIVFLILAPDTYIQISTLPT